jgi:hypothetical protein
MVYDDVHCLSFQTVRMFDPSLGICSCLKGELVEPELNTSQGTTHRVMCEPGQMFESLCHRRLCATEHLLRDRPTSSILGAEWEKVLAYFLARMC